MGAREAHIQFRTSRRDHARIRKFADDNDLTISDSVYRLVGQALDTNERLGDLTLNDIINTVAQAYIKYLVEIEMKRAKETPNHGE